MILDVSDLATVVTDPVVLSTLAAHFLRRSFLSVSGVGLNVVVSEPNVSALTPSSCASSFALRPLVPRPEGSRPRSVSPVLPRL